MKDRINYIIKERNRKEDRKDGWKKDVGIKERTLEGGI